MDEFNSRWDLEYLGLNSSKFEPKRKSFEAEHANKVCPRAPVITGLTEEIEEGFAQRPK